MTRNAALPLFHKGYPVDLRIDMDPTVNRMSAALMDKVHAFIPGDSQQAHDDRCRCAVAIKRGDDVYALLIQMGYIN